MLTWEVRIEIHGSPQCEVVWRGEAEDRTHAIRQALRHAEEQAGKIEFQTPVMVVSVTPE
jgi:hypothetical protein